MSFRKVIKVLGYSAAALLALLSLTGATVYGLTQYRLHRKHDVSAARVAIPTDDAAIARGRHIVVSRACIDCHGADLGGHKVIDDPMAGLFHAPNLTRGKGGLAADYRDVDFVRAIRHGVARDGRSLVLMPSHEYTSLSDEDLGAMIAYLKSAPAVDRERGPIEVGPMIRLLMTLNQVKLSAEEIDHNAPRPAAIAAEISPHYGKYVAASCVGCHGPNLSGGKIPGTPPDWPAAANLTPLAAGTARWTEEQFIRIIRTGERPDGTKVNPIMSPAFAQMSDLELKALWSYIATLPAAAAGAR